MAGFRVYGVFVWSKDAIGWFSTWVPFLCFATTEPDADMEARGTQESDVISEAIASPKP